ncbi:serine protease inhibitor 42Dd-like isoform X2 [Anopheles darlingi]|uniref:serine protease inhibitor 42Dd-like isoform X2 n=1 Tax=Anopheles darlingi TaxID=43151 RepID=UPI0021001725|nr:serine protease inhibitor 42Dd-like isoform X2 [Anopheles darlingi]
MGIVAKQMFQLLAIAFVILQTYQNEVHANDFSEFVKQSNDFALQLYRQVSAKSTSQNVVLSPFSISTCLSLVAMGADGETADEMFRVLRYGGADRRQQVAESYARLMKVLESDKTTTVANKVYVKAGYKVQPSFNEVAINSFQSEAQELNFTDNVAAANTINDWVESKTKKKIKEIISPGVLSGFTGIVLINAVHFLGTWKYQFEKPRTQPMPFWISATESRDVPMMNMQTNFAYKNFKDKGFSALELPYSDNGPSMLVLLPNDRNGLAALEEQLPSLDLLEVTSQMLLKSMQISLPKFKIEFSLDVENDLTALGMRRMFSDFAEFPNLLETDESLKVSKVIHKAFIEVDEKGTEATAVTYVTIVTASSMSLPLYTEFRADHPFIYVLLSREKNVYFIGKVSNPA